MNGMIKLHGVWYCRQTVKRGRRTYVWLRPIRECQSGSLEKQGG